MENPDILRKFLNYDNNSEYFSVGENGAIIQDYFKLLGNIFGNIDENGILKGEENIADNFYIPNLYSIIQSVKDIYQRYNVDRYVDPRYEFRGVNFNEEAIRDGNEPEWNISPELYDAIYKDMPEGLSEEEQALYIYTKLCLVLEYNEEYVYRGKGISYQRNEIIKKIFADEACFFKMSKDDAFLILNEVGIKDNIEEIYAKLISSDVYYDLYKKGKIDENNNELVIKYKIYDTENLFRIK